MGFCKIGFVKMHEHLFAGVLLASVGLGAVSGLAFAEPTTRATTRPESGGAAAGSGWDGSWFNYRSGRLVVEETTPTRAQVDWRQPPAKLAVGMPAPVAP